MIGCMKQSADPRAPPRTACTVGHRLLDSWDRRLSNSRRRSHCRQMALRYRSCPVSGDPRAPPRTARTVGHRLLDSWGRRLSNIRRRSHCRQMALGCRCCRHQSLGQDTPLPPGTTPNPKLSGSRTLLIGLFLQTRIPVLARVDTENCPFCCKMWFPASLI